MKSGAYRWWLLLGMGLTVLGMAIFLGACSGSKAPEAPAAPPAAPAAAGAAVAQTLCPVSGDPIDKSVFIDYQGRRIYFCCEMCPDKFTADPAKYLAILDGEQPAPTSGMHGSAPATTAPADAHAGHSHGSHESAAPVSSTAVKYTCPMHSEVVMDAPGRCPKCGMNLVPKE